jgi:hypothetical protein
MMQTGMLRRGFAFLAVAALGQLLIGGAARAASFDLNVGTHDAAAQFTGGLGVGVGVASAGGQYEVGGLFHSGSDSATDYKDGFVGLGVNGDVGLRGAKLRASVGLRGLYLDGHDASGEAVGLGGRLDLQVPPIDRVVWSVYGHYAPNVLSFGDADAYQEFGVAVGYQLLHVATLYAGYRNVAVDFKNSGLQTVDNGLHGGFQLSF